MNRRDFLTCLGAAALTAPVITPNRARATTQVVTTSACGKNFSNEYAARPIPHSLRTDLSGNLHAPLDAVILLPQLPK